MMQKNLAAVFTILISIITVHAQTYRVTMKTTMGTIKLNLFNETPLHRDNFIKLANAKQFDSTLFHRVIKNFMIQGGDPDTKRAVPDTTYGEGDLPYRIPAEIMPDIHCHRKGALGAARDDNPKKESSACQFYIVQGKVFTNGALDTLAQKRNLTITPAQRAIYTTVGGTPHLDGNYTVFGKVVKGMHVVDAIASVPTNKQYGDRPVTDVRIIKVRVRRLIFGVL